MLASPFQMDWCTCIPEPLSPTKGLGMKVAVLPNDAAVLNTMYFSIIVQSARVTKVAKRVPISICPPVPTSWWCTSTGMPAHSSSLQHAERRSWPESTGAKGV